MYKLIMSINNNEEYIVFPAVPAGIGPQYEQDNGTFQGLSRDYNTIGTMGLWSMSISGFFPVGRRHSFMPPEALEDIRLFRASGEPVDADVYLPDVPGYAYIYVNGFSAGDYLVAGGEKLTLEGWHSLTAPEKSAAAA